MRRVALVCLTPKTDAAELTSLRLPSYGIRRIQAALVGDPDLARLKVALFDRKDADVTACVEDILAFDPTLVGFSIYVWSAPFLIQVAKALKQRRPSLTIIFGGPSARAAFFDLAPYRPAHAYCDALVEGDGEEVITDLAKSPAFGLADLRAIPGLTVPSATGWLRTGSRSRTTTLDTIASPYALGLMPVGDVAYIETFRGCPLSCRFCEWGATSATKATFSVDYLTRELERFGPLESQVVTLLDAGLNLNLAGFRNLRAANARTGALRKAAFWAEIYPSIVRDEHFAFLEEVGPAFLGVGMQSMDPDVLRLHDRPADSPKFEAAVRALAAVTEIELQIIAGLPGDTPQGFRRTLDYALSFPAKVRVFHCLVLPDALLTRARPEWQIRFDPRTLVLRSCHGWTEEAIGELRAELRARSLAAGGSAGEFWWSFPRPRMRRAA